MNTFFTILIKGVVGIIWLLATIITSVLLSPFILIAWISKIPGKKKKTNLPEKQVNESQPEKVSAYEY